jgi:hypothetical protein
MEFSVQGRRFRLSFVGFWVFGFGAWFFWVFGFRYGFESKPKNLKKPSSKPKPKPKNQKIFGLKKKYEKIYSLKYLNKNKLFLKPNNFWVFGF